MDVYNAALKEWYWFVILGALVAVAFCPLFLKAKCPNCKRRQLKSVDVNPDTRRMLEAPQQRGYLTFYRCDACDARVLQELSRPYEDASDNCWDAAFDPALVTAALAQDRRSSALTAADR